VVRIAFYLEVMPLPNLPHLQTGLDWMFYDEKLAKGSYNNSEISLLDTLYFQNVRGMVLN